MQINLGKFSFGIRDNAKHTWKQYLIPRETQGKSHPFFKFGIWWLCFFLYYPKKCPMCTQWMPTTGGIREYDSNGKFVRVVCRDCHKSLY